MGAKVRREPRGPAGNVQVSDEKPMNTMGMRGLSMSGAKWRTLAGAMLAVVFLTATQAVPVHAAVTPGWKEAVADIEVIRDGAIQELLDLAGAFDDYLTGEPSAAEAADELTNIHGQLAEVAALASEEIGSIMDAYPDSSKVQDSGTFAIAMVMLTKDYSIDISTGRYDEYVDGLPPPPSTTTTTQPVPVTTTTVPVTTTTVPSTTTTTAPRSTTTTTVPAPATTTTVPAPTTTTTTTAASSTVPTTDPPSSGPTDQPLPIGAEGVGETLGPGIPPPATRDTQLLAEAEPSTVPRANQRGITASLTRVLDPVLPAAVADVVVSPLLVLELLWRAISSSGRGLVMPISLLLFSVISLLWDRRSKKAPAVA